MRTIDISIKDKIAMQTGGEAFIVRDNSDYVINFTFDAEWAEETAKTARFALQGGGYIDVPFTGGSVAVPVISTGRRVDVGVFAGNLRTTTSAILPLVPSIRSKGGAPIPPEEAVYDKLIALINSMGEISDDDIKQTVEDYLSANPIAAASMRVEAGYIQFSADGETWTDIIAISDLKGPPGAGIDITGASVGQIPKITAVDADGKPTAWEAVDMPSGGSETWSITNTLTNATTSNSATTVAKGGSYIATITADSGYGISNVTVTMGGVDITSTVWNADTGTIAIEAVTGDVIIVVLALSRRDTSPVIAKTGYGLSENGEESNSAIAGACYTDFYELKSNATFLLLYLADTAGVAFGNSGKLQFWSDTEFMEYWSAAAHRNQEYKYTTGGAARFRTVLALADVESSYAYDNNGHIYFAGKNTQYYGLANIDGTVDVAPASTAAAVDNAVMALGRSTGVTANPAAYTGLSSDYVSIIQANYDAFIAEIMGDYNKIPIIVHTDQHGRIGAGNPVLKLIGDIVNWNEISKCINLGDTVSNRFGAATLQTYLDAAKDCIPLSRRLDVYGNHDTWDADEDQKYTVDQKRLSPYFKNIYARRRGNNGYFTVVDDYYNVKYLVVNNMEYPSTNYNTRRITTAQADFLVGELGKKDGYDIILLSHIPFVADSTLTSRDASYEAYTEQFLSDAAANASFLAMIAARKAKTGGTFTDSEGTQHAYDFAGCDGELLMSLHGHTHFEAYKHLSGSITEFAFDWFDGNTFYFAYIDRSAKKFKCWKNESGVEPLEISIEEGLQ
jgi:hypothetical protein